MKADFVTGTISKQGTMADAVATGREQLISQMPHFLITKGPERGTSIELDFTRLAEQPLVLGRAPGENGVSLQTYDRRMSRKHFIARFRSDDEILVIAPHAEASNGTKVNSEPIAGITPLLPGDTISCADVDMVFVVPITGLGLPIVPLPGQTARQYLEDFEPGMARLEIIASSIPFLEFGAVCRLTPRHPFLMGRHPESDLPFPEAHEEARKVSRRHCEISWVRDGYIIRDMGAPNPAWVNQDRLEVPRRLEDGDSLQVGPVLLRYRAPRLPLPEGPVSSSDPAQVASVRLRSVDGQELEEGPSQVLLPTDRQVLIGRAEGNDLRLSDPSVSRRHARLFFEAKCFLLADLGSANGTKVNGQDIDGLVVLQSGDRLKLGDFEFIFEEVNSSPSIEGDSAASASLIEPVVLRLKPSPDGKRPGRSTSEIAVSAADAGSPPATPGPVQTTTSESQPINHPLRGVAPFDELDSATFKMLLPYFKEVRYKPGYEMAREGQQRGVFFVILGGRVSISRTLNDKQRLVLGELEAGMVYGARSIYADQPFANRLTALTEVRALRLEENIFVRDLARHRTVQTFFREQVVSASAANWLRGTLLMRTLSETTRRALAQRLRYREYGPGEVLATQGQSADEFFLVLGGTAKAYVKDSKGREMLLATLEEGDIFGDGIAAAGETYSITVRSEQQVECFVLARADFESVLAKSGDPIASLGAGLGGLPLGAVLNRVSPFNTMPPQLVAKIAAQMKPKFFKKGETIVSQNETASAFYIIRSGQVEVSFRTSEGEVRSDMRLGAGQYFGEASLLTNTARTDSVKAVEDCELLALYRDKLDAVLKLGEGYDLAQYFTKGLNKRFRPKQVATISITEQTLATGEHFYMLNQGDGEQFFRLSERNLFLWNLMNGDNSLNDLSMAYFLEYKQLDLEGVSNLVGQLQAGGFLEVPPIDESLVSTGERKPGLVSRIFNWQYEIRSVDRIFGRLYQWGGQVFFWKPMVFILVGLLLAGFGAFIFWGFFDHRPPVAPSKIGQGVADRMNIIQIFQGGGAGVLAVPGALPFYAVLLVLLFNFIIHEIAHGLAVKAYGRRVISGGFGWRGAGPFFFVNTNEIWLEKRGPRIVVNLSGPISNALFAGACCLLMFASSNPDIQVALFQMAAVAYMLVYINVNPLLELDGYYALMDWLEIPGLRRKSFAFVRRKLLKKPIKRMPGPRERRIFWWFALLTPVYLIFTLVQFMFFLISFLSSFFTSIGVMIGPEWNWLMGTLLPLAMVIFLGWPLVTELLTAGRDEEELEEAAQARRRRKIK